jgi:hypothetical protein
MTGKIISFLFRKSLSYVYLLPSFFSHCIPIPLYLFILSPFLLCCLNVKAFPSPLFFHHSLPLHLPSCPLSYPFPNSFICSSCCHFCPHTEANAEDGLHFLHILVAAYWVFPEQKGTGCSVWMLELFFGY